MPHIQFFPTYLQDLAVAGVTKRLTCCVLVLTKPTKGELVLEVQEKLQADYNQVVADVKELTTSLFWVANSLNPSHMPCMHLRELSYLFCFIWVASTDTWERIMETECDIMQFFWMSCYAIVWSVCWLMISFISFMVYPSVAAEALP